MISFKIIILAIMVAIAGIINTESNVYITKVITVYIMWAIGLFTGYFLTTDKLPSAIDVYRGNTELRITSVNGIPTDTIVVWKNKQ